MASETKNYDTSVGTPNPGAAVTDSPDSVDHVSATVAEWKVKTALARTLLGGTKAMHTAGKAFLPQHVLESDKGYQERLDNSTLLNAFGKTCSFLAGQVFQKDVIWAEGTPPVFEDWANKIDTAGNSFDVFGKRVFQNGLGKGVAHVLVDVPKKDHSIVTKEDEKKAGIRPYFKEVKPEDILGFIVDDDGAVILIRIAETVTKRVGTYGTKVVDRVRVLEPGKWEIFEMSGDSMKSVDSGEFSIPIIPLLTFMPGNPDSIMTAESPLQDLAELNKKHWRNSSDQDNYLTYCRFPIYFGKKLGDLPILPAGKTLISSDDDDADLKTVEMTGSSIQAGADDIKETEAQMALYGLQQLLPRVGNMTATEKAITSAESNSSLGTWATEYEVFANDCFVVAGLFMKVALEPNSVEVNKEYNFGVADPQELLALLAAKEAGVASAKETFVEFRRRGAYNEHTDWDDMKADIEQEKRDNLDMAKLAGSTFGDDNTGDDNGTDN